MPFVDVGGKSSHEVVKPATVRESLPAILVASFSAFGGLLYGWDTGTISGILAMKYFRRQFGHRVPVSTDAPTGYNISTSDQSLVVSILSVGTFFGSLSGAFLADKLGRKWGIQSALAIFCVGVAMQTASTELNLFVAGRTVAGFGIGIVSTIVPLYQSETAPRWIRGAVVSGYQWFITIGLLLAACTNKGSEGYDSPVSYRLPIAMQFVLAAIMSAGLFFLPESPRWLTKRGDHERAAIALAKLYSTEPDSALVRSELTDVRANLEIELSHGNASYFDCFKPNERKNLQRTLTGMALQAWQQLSGINFIFYYGTIFFQTISSSDPFIFTIISNVVNVASTLPGMWMMERVGRRNLLIGGAMWMAVCELIVAAIGSADFPVGSARRVTGGKAQVAFVCIYVAGFASTWGPAAWVVCGEIFPLAIRAKSLSLCVASNWLLNWAIGYATPYLVDAIGINVFYIWFGCLFGAMTFAYFFIYETSGLSLEEVDELYAATTAFKSKKSNHQMRAQRAEMETEATNAFAYSDEAATADEYKRDIIATTGDHK